MPLIRSDDGPRKLRAVWLGPKGGTLPFEWTYVQWVVSLGLAFVSGLVILVLLWVVWAPIYGLVGSVMYGIPSGLYLGAKVMRKVSFDEPVQYRAAMARGQLRDRGQPAINDPMQWQIDFPPIRDISPGARKALGWPPDNTLTEKGESNERSDQIGHVRWHYVGGRSTAPCRAVRPG